jgi:HlyD family secretion protein
MARSYIRRIGVTLAVLAGVATLVWKLQPSPIAVSLARVEKGPLTSTLTADGRTRIRDVYSVVAPVDGDVERITLKVGDHVSEESVVARMRPVPSRPLDDRTRAEAIAAVSTAETAVTQAVAIRKESEAALVHAESELITARKLANEGLSPKNNAEHAEHQVEIQKKAVEAATAGIDTAKAELARAQVRATSTSTSSAQPPMSVRSPVRGRVLKVLNESGGPVSAGAPLIEIGNTVKLEITTDLLTEDAMKVAPGAPALIREWGGSEPLKAKLRNIEPAAFTKVSALGLEEQRVRAILDFAEAPPASLGHDFHVSVSVIVWHDANVLTVPSTALFRSGKDWTVFVVRDEHALLQVVDVGQSDGTRTAISRGLTEGDQVVSQPSDLLRDGSRVKSIQ